VSKARKVRKKADAMNNKRTTSKKICQSFSRLGVTRVCGVPQRGEEGGVRVEAPSREGGCFKKSQTRIQKEKNQNAPRQSSKKKKTQNIIMKRIGLGRGGGGRRGRGGDWRRLRGYGQRIGEFYHVKTRT